MIMEVGNKTSQLVRKPTGKNEVDGKKDPEEAKDDRYASAADYMKELMERFDYLGRRTKIDGVPTTATISPVYLEKCRNDPEKRNELERNLVAMKDGVAYCSRRTVYCQAIRS